MPALEDIRFNINSTDDRKILVKFLGYYFDVLASYYRPMLPPEMLKEFNEIHRLVKSSQALNYNSMQVHELLSRVNRMAELPYQFSIGPEHGVVRHLDKRTFKPSKYLRQFKTDFFSNSKKQKQVSITKKHPVILGLDSIDLYHMDISKMTLAQKRGVMEVVLKNLMNHGIDSGPYDSTSIEKYSEEVINNYLTSIKVELVMHPNSDTSKLLNFSTNSEAGRKHFAQNPSKRQKTPVGVMDPQYTQVKPLRLGRKAFIQTKPQLSPEQQKNLNITASSRAFADRIATLSPNDPEFSLLGLHAQYAIIELHNQDAYNLPDADLNSQRENLLNAVRLDQSEGWNISGLLASFNKPKHLLNARHGYNKNLQQPKGVVKDPNRPDRKP